MVIMKKTILLTMTTLTLFSMSPNSAQAYTNDSKTLEEAKKAHPNAQFKVNKDTGAYTYTYDKTTRQTTIIKISHVHTQTNQSRTKRQQQSTISTYINDAIDSHTRLKRQQQSVPSMCRRQ